MSIIHVPEGEDLDGLTRSEVLDLAVDESDMEAAFEDMLEDVYGDVQICGLTYSQARALRELDPVAYRCGYADFVSEWYVEVDPDGFPESIDTEGGAE